jgi:Tfp pilus assembly protein PilN
MLRTNLATRPFYNDRGIRVAIGAVALVAVGLTIFNAAEVWRLQSQNRELGQEVRRNEQQARELRDKARVTRQSLNRDDLAAVEMKAREANQLIDRRAFSWTELLNQFQATLPADVRITSVQPQIDSDGRMLVAVSVVSRRIEDIEEFIEAMEQTGSFTGVLSRQDTADEDGTIRSVLQGYYHLASAKPAAEAKPGAPASEPAREAR